MSDTTAPPAPTAAAPAPPDSATAAPPIPAPAPAVEPAAETEPRTRRRRGGIPIEPLVIGVLNGTATATTAAYQAAGPMGIAAAAGTAVVLAAGGVVQRRRTVRRRATTAAGRTRGGASGSPRGRTRGGASSGSSGRGAASGRGGASRRGGSSGASGAGSGARGGAGRTRRGALGSLGGRGAGRLKTPRLNSPKNGGKHKRPGKGGTSPSKQKRTPRTRSRLGMVRPAASAARRGMAGVGRGLRATGRGIRGTGRGIAAGARGVGRAARWTAAPARALWRGTAAARRGAGRRIARAAGAVWDGALAGLGGLAAAVWRWSGRAGLDTLRAIWQRRRRNRAARQAANGPAMTGPTIAATPPPVAPYVRRPATAGGSPSTLGGRMSGGHHFLAPAMELERIATTYTPDGMMQVGRDFGALPDALEHIANAMKITTARADAEQPLDPNIVEIMKQIYLLQMKASTLARDLAPAFKRLHHVDITRLQNPRKGAKAEAEWDVRANADTSL
ncbi:hypothetical protein [Streptomyces sp. NBC_00038]|uniref:hypothetical protein n=1 Tax=Streptomyces sp. NBC_00038 TaxID=2903615 RepID=UPI0022584C8F|nr:hypothetical protein [Streptomyces sp. NBC_00038]MCX5562740.1 hypothetical protein [Streptomyces sp. NBC_00038]MCX5563610.1 hypothetical protein [Streptomyces sp. NBC_00038]